MIPNRLTIGECVKAMRAERGKRINVYAKWVAEGKMTQERQARGMLEIDSTVDYLEAVEAMDEAARKLCEAAGIKPGGTK